MDETGVPSPDSKELAQRLRDLEENQRATLNVLEDFDEEQRTLADTQSALMNMLEDVEAERTETEQAKALLETVNKELEAFTYSVSHDLRAPLRAISGFAEAVVEDYGPQLDDEGKRYLGLIQSNAHQMGQLIDDLLNFSRLGRQQMSVAQVDLDALARTVFDELSALEPKRRIAFEIGRVPPAQADPSLVRQVLANLLSNAIKFTRLRAEASVEFGYEPNRDGGAYYVRDNGVGFDMRYVGKLFGVFQRLHPATEFEGTGVGLALVQRILSRHGGRAWAEGAVDRGAVFYFTLPARESQ
jgi:two-component system sensor kinase